MDLSQFDPYSGTFRAASTIDLQAGSVDSLEDSVWDYIGRGTVSAITSAAVGLLNTGIALGDVVGLADDEDYLDEGEVISNIWGETTGDFYDRHKTGIDAIGMVAGSFVPGLGAVKLLRIAQRAGKLPVPVQLTTGMRNADIVLGSKQLDAASSAIAKKSANDIVLNSKAVDTAKKSVFNTNVSGVRNPEVLRAYRAGVGQAFMESAAFDLGIVAAMNQNATLNPDDLGYFQSAKNVFMESVPFTLAGGVLGGGLEVLRVKGAISKHVAGEFQRTGKYRIPDIAAIRGMTPGDKFVALGEQLELRKSLLKEIDETDGNALSAFAAGTNQIKQAIRDTAEQAGVKSAEQLKVIDNLMNKAGDGELRNVASILSGLTNINRITNTDFTELTKFYDKVKGPTGVFRFEDSDKLAEQVADRQQEFADVLNRMGLDDYAESISPERIGISIGRFGDEGSNAAVIPNQTDIPPDVNIRLSYVNVNNEQAMFVPEFMYINEPNIRLSYEMNQEWARKTGQPFEMTLEEYDNSVFLHELGHIKSNGDKVVRLVQNSLDRGTNRKVMEQLVAASIRRRPMPWQQSAGKLKEADIVKEVVDWFENPDWLNPPAWQNYLGTPKELLADGAAYFANEATRQQAAKQFPELGRLFNRTGAIAKAWDDTKAFYNSRTGKTYSSILPGIQDIATSARLREKKGVYTLDAPELSRTFARDKAAFSSLLQRAIDKELDILDMDAQWNIVARMDIKKDILPKSKDAVLNIAADDLPMMERVSKELIDDARLNEQFGNRIQYDGLPVSPEELRQITISRKIDLRNELLLNNRTPYINERKLEKILNVSEEFAMGSNQADSLLYGSKNFLAPENHKFSYAHKTPEDYKGAAISMQGYEFRQQIIEEQRQMVAAELLDEHYENFTEAPWERIFDVAPTDQRSSLVGGMRPDFGTLREWAQYIGKQTSQALSNIIHGVDEAYVPHVNKFNRPDGVKLRMELAQIDNLARRNWYYHAKFTDEDGTVKQVLVAKQAVHDGVNELAKMFDDTTIEFDPAMLDNLAPEIVDLARGAKLDSGDSAFVELSAEVGDFIGAHIQKNRTIVQRKRRLSALEGKEAIYDENVFYTPPRDLRDQKFHAFVVPTEAMAGSDPRQFMIFGNTEAEFNSKLDMIRKKYGQSYRVVTRDEVNQYKKLMGDFDKDMVFDEIFFDSSLARMGKASELFPNLDVQTSNTLDRYRSWTIRQEEALFRHGVELKNQKLVESLRRVDKEYSKVGRTILGGKFKEQDSIWQDTLNTMMATRGYGSVAEQMFVRVNDFVGNIGSKAIDAAINSLRPSKSGVGITDEAMESFNRQLEAQGLQAPTRSAVEAIVTSPNIAPSKTLNHMVRTLSSLVSLSMLRLDPAHGILQVLSTPILGLPVLQELKASLKGTARGADLENMTTVVNPANGMREPTAQKLVLEGTQKFFTEEGKQFIKELKDRNIVSDYLVQYLDTLDFSTLNGNHRLHNVSKKIDDIAQHLSKYSGFRFSEEFTRFQIAWAAKRMGEVGGKTKDEMWPMISGAVDKVHGVYIGNQRPQFFQGALGQAMGLYQTYFFNFMQNMMKFYQNGERKQLMTLAAMQTTMFGTGSWTGFEQLNRLIGETNSGNLDLYSVSNADDPNSLAAYFMYGLGSHALGMPIDFYSRGNLSVRHATVLPTSPWDFPIVSTLAKAGANMVETTKMIGERLIPGGGEGAPIGEAMLHGLAHNGMNRPIQGFANIIRNRVTSNNGQVQWDDITHNGNSIWDAEDIYWSGMFARIIGARPLNESIITNAYFRDAGYQANNRRSLIKVGKQIQFNAAAGTLDYQAYQNFAKEYEGVGGEAQNFNAYWARQLQNAKKPVMEDFKRELLQDSSYRRMIADKSTAPPWTW